MALVLFGTPTTTPARRDSGVLSSHKVQTQPLCFRKHISYLNAVIHKVLILIKSFEQLGTVVLFQFMSYCATLTGTNRGKWLRLLYSKQAWDLCCKKNNRMPDKAY